MTQRAPGRKSALLGLSVLAFLVVGMLSPAAYAQIPGVEVPTVEAPPAIGGGSDGGSGDSGSGDTGSGDSGIIGSTVEAVTEVTDKTTDPVGNVLEDAGEATGNDTVEQTGKTLGNTTKTVGETVGGAARDVDQTVGGIGGGIGGGIVKPDLLVIGDPRDRDPKKHRTNEGSTKGSEAGQRSNEQVKGGRFAVSPSERMRELKNASLKAAEAKTRRVTVTPATAIAPAPARETFITQLADAAVDATKKLAFPLGLALMVGAFLMVQGRIDRKDAKLALAPINSEQDLLSFQ